MASRGGRWEGARLFFLHFVSQFGSFPTSGVAFPEVEFPMHFTSSGGIGKHATSLQAQSTAYCCHLSATTAYSGSYTPVTPNAFPSGPFRRAPQPPGAELAGHASHVNVKVISASGVCFGLRGRRGPRAERTAFESVIYRVFSARAVACVRVTE